MLDIRAGGFILPQHVQLSENMVRIFERYSDIHIHSRFVRTRQALGLWPGSELKPGEIELAHGRMYVAGLRGLSDLLREEIDGANGLLRLQQAILGMLTQEGPDRECRFLMPLAWLISDNQVAPGGRVRLSDNYAIALVAVVDDGVAMGWFMPDGVHRNFDRRGDLTAGYQIGVGGRLSKTPGVQLVVGSGTAADTTTLFTFGGLPDELAVDICRELLDVLKV